ncbi:hypothetical protein N7449_011548 [Penicillium cf. viridicatum]|uniref:Uncharacterized protein n=1 Tax=Penicillium cf. viridicatum TaxID=2972119 RepID=A0A9W9IQ81_9EURO|nr:hypothetical protein N7449_011548 [Penicillium cf. viridicatum]
MKDILVAVFARLMLVLIHLLKSPKQYLKPFTLLPPMSPRRSMTAGHLLTALTT